MSEITLREYLNELEALAKSDQYDEIVQHCRHILRYYPKNVRTYQLLGTALLALGRYEEAGDVLRRVLSVYPDDYHAHLGLSEVYRSERRVNEALWHLERAFEQTPNDQRLLGELRELYRQRGAEPTKIQLTTRAVADQYYRSGLYAKAADTLQKALGQMPTRTDLRLLLAQVLWEQGYKVEAAENALEVLKTLPDCLEANRMMTALWLGEGRPSDAQRYVSRIEAVDPYLAFELAQGTPPPDSAFTLNELDYQREASRSLTSESPDWLQALASESDDVTIDDDNADWLQSLGTVQQAADAPTRAVPPVDRSRLTEQNITEDSLDDLFADMDTSASDDDDWLSALDDQSTVPETGQRTGLTGLLSGDNLPDNSGSTGLTGLLSGDVNDPDERTGLTGLLGGAENSPTGLSDRQSGDMFGDDLQNDLQDEDPLAWMRDSGVEFADTTNTSEQTEESDSPFAWMRDSGVELTEDEPGTSGDIFGLDDAPEISDPAANPFAWMQSSGVEFTEDAGDAIPAWLQTGAYQDTGETDDEDHSDPLAWMYGSGIEMAEDTAPAEQPAVAEQRKQSDWLADDSLLDEMLDIETLTQTGDLTSTGDLTPKGSLVPGDLVPDDVRNRQAEMTDRNDLPDWMRDDDDQSSDDQLSSGGQSSSDSFNWLAGDDDALTDDALDWMTDPEDEAAPAAPDIPDWLAAARPATPSDTNADALEAMLFNDDSGSADFNLLTEDEEATDDEAVPSWLAGMEPAAASPDTGYDLFGDMEDEEATDDDEAVPSWLAGMEPAATTSPDTGYDLFGDMEDDDEQTADDEAVPSWLAGMEPAATTSPDTGYDLFGDMEDDDEQTADDEAVPSWLAGMEPAASPDTDYDLFGDMEDDEAVTEEEEFPDWMVGIGTASIVQDEEFASAETGDDGEEGIPEWLAAMEPGSSAPAMADDEDDEFTLFGSDDEDEQVPVTATQTFYSVLDEDEDDEDGATPDWLAAVGRLDNTAEETVSDSEIDEMFATLEEENAISPETEAVLFGTFNPANEEPQAYIWDADDQPAVTARADEMPDWLMEVGSMAEDEPAAAVEEPDWLASVGTRAADEEDYEIEDEAMPDWLAEVGVVAEDEPTDEEDEFVPAAKPVTDALADMQMPSWLGEDETADEAYATEAGVSEYDWLDDEVAVEETQPTPATNAPDWLNAMVPGLDLDYNPQAQAEEAEPAVQEYTNGGDDGQEFTWLTQLVEDELRPPEIMPETTSNRRFAFARAPRWLRRLRGEEAPTATRDVPGDDDDLPPWLSFNDTE